MSSTFMGLEIGKRGMATHQTALNTTGHNLSNLNTEGYSRQRVLIGTTDPLYMPAYNRAEVTGQLGQGPKVTQIERIFDILHETQILSIADDLGYWQSRDHYIGMLERIYSEPNEAASIRGFMDSFWNSWQDLAANPENLSSRTVVAQSGKSLAEAINNRFSMLEGQRTLINDDIKATVADINSKISQIAALNNQIATSKALGDSPNDLLDRRDLIVGKLAHLMPVTVDDRSASEFQVHLNGRYLVQGSIAHPLKATEEFGNDGMVKVDWVSQNLELDPYVATTGKLSALIELRDKDLYLEIQKLDALAINFSDMVNDLHRNGTGRNGETGLDFFTQHPIIENIQGNYDRTGDGVADSTYLFRLAGYNKLNATDIVGIDGVLTLQGGITVNYFSSDTVGDIINRINYSSSDLSVRLDHSGKLSFKGAISSSRDNPDFVIRHLEDSGQFLVGYAGLLNSSGPDGAYDYNQINAGEERLRMERGASYTTAPLRHPSAWISVNDSISTNLNRIAAAMPTANGEAAIGDNRIAIAMADLRHEKVMIDRLTSMDDFFADGASIIGSKGKEAGETRMAFEAIFKNFSDIKESISGVNINEEFADMIRFQHGFAASSRYISVVDSMLDTIINRMGV